MTKKNHLRAWHHRRRAKKRNAASVGRSRDCPLRLETLEDRSLLSGITAADGPEGGFVQLSTGNLVTYHFLHDTADSAGNSHASTTRVRVNSDFEPRVAGSVAFSLATGPMLSYQLIEASEGAFVMRIVSKDLPKKATDAGSVDVTPSTDDGNLATEGGLVDLTPTLGDTDPFSDPFLEKTRQLGSGLAQHFRKTTADSAARNVAVEGAGGRSQAFELAMVSDWRMDGNNAPPHANLNGPYGDRATAPVRPATTQLPGEQGHPPVGRPTSADSEPTTNQRHAAVSRQQPSERSDKASLVSAINLDTDPDWTKGGVLDLGRQDAGPAEASLANRLPDGSATRVAPMPDSVLDRQQMVLAEEENWTQGDLDWLTSNVYQRRQTPALALVAAALVSLRSLGLHLSTRDENQVLWIAPRERRGTDSV